MFFKEEQGFKFYLLHLMLHKGRILLLASIDGLIAILSTIEWANPVRGMILVLGIHFTARSRWSWQVIVPSLLVFHFPNMKAYFKRIQNESEQKNTFDLILEVNSLRQHALFLLDRLLWLYKTEVDWCIEAFNGDLSFKARLLVISLIVVFFGVLRMGPFVFEAILLYGLLKHSSFGTFFKGCLDECRYFILLVQFYDSIFKDQRHLPDVFDKRKRADDWLLSVEIVENVDSSNGQSTVVSFMDVNGKRPISCEEIERMKPILQLMDLTVSPSERDDGESKSKIWRWERALKHDFNDNEWEFISVLLKLID
jgi:hypothetical protein